MQGAHPLANIINAAAWRIEAPRSLAWAAGIEPLGSSVLYVCVLSTTLCPLLNRKINRKLKISAASTKREPAYSQALIQNKIDRQRVRSRETDSQTAMVDGAWS